MPDYKEMYNKLCHAQAKLDYLLEEARAVIRDVQQETEHLYLEAKEPVELAASPLAEAPGGDEAL